MSVSLSDYIMVPAFVDAANERGRVYAIVHCFTEVTVTLLSRSSMETGNGQDTLLINDGESHWPAVILAGSVMFLLAAWHHPPSSSLVHSITLQTYSHSGIIVICL